MNVHIGLGWTDERVETLKRLWKEGYSASQIAAELGGGISRNGVIGKVHRLKLNATPRPRKSGNAGSDASVRSKARKKAVRDKVTARQSHDLPAQRLAHFRPGKIETIEDSGIVGVPFLEVSDRTCRWPLWGMEPISYEQKLCCGASVRDGSVYCERHHIRGINPHAR